MSFPTPPLSLPGSQAAYVQRRCVTRRLHNRRIIMVSTPDGGYQLQMAKVLTPEEVVALRQEGHRDTVGDFILRNRVRYSVLTISAEAFEAAVWCWEQLKGRQQRKR